MKYNFQATYISINEAYCHKHLLNGKLIEEAIKIYENRLIIYAYKHKAM